MPQYVIDDESYFEQWYGTFAGRFLAAHPTDPTTPVVDTEMLIVHAPRLSTGEQIAAGIWWNVVMQAPAPWVTEPLTKLSHLDFNLLDDVSRLLAGARRRLDPRSGIEPGEGASTP